MLAPYAVSDAESRGRRYPESSPRYRGEFQRDRDRIVHCSAFRRLEYKTQVFVNHEGDMFRTRLTHSIEVAQIGRSIARVLGINEDLVEAVALAHDLGHTPFGHAGQDALNDCMRDYGGFEHNLQSLRVVDELEQRYAEFPGLNLTFETREGILKHCALHHAGELGELGTRFLHQQQPSLEAQVANVADEIAYNNHDVDDGLRAGLITLEQLDEITLFDEHHRQVRELFPQLNGRRVSHEIVRRMINHLVVDLVETSQARLAEYDPVDVSAVRACSGPLIGFSDGMKEKSLQLKRFLRKNMYRHYRVHRMTAKARRIIHALFDEFMNDPALLPDEARINLWEGEQEGGSSGRARAVADYIAGMTDRFAIAEYERLFNPHIT